MTKNPHDHLHGLSPRARNKHNLNVISEYLFRVGYSTPELMKSLIGNRDAVGSPMPSNERTFKR